jgi:TonB family protein
MFAVCVLLSVSTVDEAIELYEMGDIPGAIVALEAMLDRGSLSFDEELRAWDRLGSSYFAMGNTSAASEAYSRLLRLDVYYDFSPRANPRLQTLLDDVRNRTMASAMVRSEPAGAFVTLDGQIMGVTPIMLDGLMGGNSYSVDVYQVGYSAEYYTLLAQPGSNHMLEFTLSVLPDPSTASVASGDQTEAQAGSSAGLRPDEMVTSPFESSQSAADAGSVATAASHQAGSTAELIAMLSGGGGIDVSSLNSTAGFSTESHEAVGLAGSSGRTGEVISSGIAAQAEALGREIMVFSDLSDMAAPTATGSGSYSSRSAEEIAELVAGKRSQVMYIYNKHLRNDPLLMGRVEIALIVHPSGRVSDVEIVSSNMYSPAFELELARAVEQWRFGSVSENEGPLPIQLPFSFSP